MDHDDDEPAPPVPFPWGNDVCGILGATAFCAARMRLVAFLLYGYDSISTRKTLKISR